MEGLLDLEVHQVRPLTIRAIMRDPIVSYDGRVMLDGILEHVAWRRAGRRTFALGDPPVSYEIPLERLGEGDLWVWRCSAPRCQVQFTDLTHKTRQFPFSRGRMLKTSERKINVGAGPTKGYRLPLPLMFSPYFEWSCVGDADAVRSMLSEVSWIGKEHNRGRGRVLEWVVEGRDFDDSLLTADSRPARPLPVDLLTDHERDADEFGWLLGVTEHRAPYWHQDRRVECYLPDPLEVVER